MRSSANIIVVAGSLAQRPNYGGHTWVLLQYLLGFKRLGWNVHFVDRLEPEMCQDETGEQCSVNRSRNLRYFLNVMWKFGLEDSFTLLYGEAVESFGATRQELIARLRDAALLLNVMGFLNADELVSEAPRRLFLDIDPGFPQMWRALGLADVFQGHNAFATVGQNVGKPDCVIPDCGLTWIPTLPPVVLEHWPVARQPGDRITSVMSWRGPFGPIEFGGQTYGLRAHEFRRFMELPSLSEVPYEIALNIDEADQRDRQQLVNNKWRLTDPVAAAGDPDRYREFVRGSLAELMIAKQMYVQTASGWVSDRSVCYLASGRPVIAQDTGLEGLPWANEGFLRFRTMSDAASQVRELVSHYQDHSIAARRAAESYFDSDIVLPKLLSAVGVH